MSHEYYKVDKDTAAKIYKLLIKHMKEVDKYCPSKDWVLCNGAYRRLMAQIYEVESIDFVCETADYSQYSKARQELPMLQTIIKFNKNH